MEEVKVDLTKLQDPYEEKRYITEGEKPNSKYGKLVFEFPQECNEVQPDGADEDFIVKPQAYFRGASQIPGAEFNQSYQIFVKPFFLDRVQHRHDKDEYLIFLGASFPNVFDFDAKIEFTLGKGDEAETYVITKPTMPQLPTTEPAGPEMVYVPISVGVKAKMVTIAVSSIVTVLLPTDSFSAETW